MLGQIGAMSNTMKGLGVIAATQRPFIAFLIKNWPLAAIAGYALFVRGKKRWEDNEFNSYNLFADAGLIITPLVGLALLNNMAQEQATAAAAVLAAQTPAPSAAAPTGSSITDMAIQAAQSAFGTPAPTQTSS